MSYGSRAACISRRSLEILDQLGVARDVLGEALPWTAGTSFYRDVPVYRLQMPMDENQRFAPMVNLEQCICEQLLADRADALARARRDPLADEARGPGAGRRRRGARPRDGAGALSPPRRLGRRLRRRAVGGAPGARPQVLGLDLRRHVHHRRHPPEVRLPDRAPRLVRSADQSRLDDPHAPAAARHLARRLPAPRRRGSGRGGQAGERAAARAQPPRSGSASATTGRRCGSAPIAPTVSPSSATTTTACSSPATRRTWCRSSACAA